MSEFQITECQCCGNRIASNFKEKEDGFVCKSCGVWFRYENSEEKRGCADGYKHLRKYQFEEACDEFETVICNNPGSIDARWGLLLSRFGIVFIKGFFDNVTEPIYCFPEYDELEEGVFRKQREYTEILNILDSNAKKEGDSNLSKKSLELRYFYEKKAKEIDRAIKKFSDCKRNTERDVFICVKISAATEKNPQLPGETEDCQMAKQIYSELEKRGIRTFFSYKTLKNEVNSDDLIWLNLVKSRKMILIGSQRDYLESAWVKSEWKRWKFLERLEDLYVLVLKHNHEYPKDVLPHELRKSQIYTLDTYDKLISDICSSEQTSTEEDRMRAVIEEEIRKREENSAAERARLESEETARRQREAEETARKQREAEETARKQREAEEAARKQREAEETARRQRVNTQSRSSAPSYSSESIYAPVANFSTGDGKIVYENGSEERLPYGMTEIGEKAYYNRQDIVSVVLPGSVKAIGDQAFSWCYELKSVVLPQSLERIDRYAFNTCKSLTKIVFPNTLKTIDASAFSNCESLSEVYIPESVAKISSEAFRGSKIKIHVSPKNKHFKSIDGVLYSADGNTLLFFSDLNTKTSFTIPAGVTAIGECAFWSCKTLKTINFPEGLISIGRSAFSWSHSLDNFTFPNSLMSIEGQTFCRCKSLTNIVIPPNITEIDYCTFSECENIRKLTLPKSIKEIKWEAFKDCTNLSTIYYEGSKSDWKQIKIGKGNPKLNGLFGKAIIYFNSEG